MPIGVPKVPVPYDSEGNIPLRYYRKNANKRRFDDDKEFGHLFDEEVKDKLNKKSSEELDEYDNLNKKSSEELDEDDNLNKKSSEELDEDDNLNKKSSEEEDEDDDFGPASYEDLDEDSDEDWDSPNERGFNGDYGDDSPYEAAKKRKQKEEEEKAKTKWYDLLEVLHREGVIFLGREMTMKFANTIISLLVYLDQEGKRDRTPTMFINSPGGFVFSGLSIYDTMDLVRIKTVQTIALGIAASMASVVLIGGGKRVALAHAKVMIHQPRMKAFEDESTEIALEARVLIDLRNSITEIYVRKTGKTYKAITGDMEVDTFLTAKAARAYGIVDGIIPRESDDSDDGLAELYSL